MLLAEDSVEEVAGGGASVAGWGWDTRGGVAAAEGRVGAEEHPECEQRGGNQAGDADVVGDGHVDLFR